MKKAFNLLGYRPRPPVELKDFIYPEKRSVWIKEKGLTVFSLWNPEHPATEIDIFVESPVIFKKAYTSSISFNPDCAVGDVARVEKPKRNAKLEQF